MAGYGINQVDGMALLEAFRAGRGDRAADDKRRAAAEKEKEWSGALGELFGAPQSGVQQKFAPSSPGKPVPSAAEAFGAPSIDETPPAASAPRAAAPQAPARQRVQLNPVALARAMAIDPETTVKIIGAVKQMDEMQLKQAEAKNTALGAAAHWLARQPEAQRRQMLGIIAPQLIQAGWSPEEIAQADLGDQALAGYQKQAMAMDAIIDNDLAEREFQAGKTVPVTAGGNVAIVTPDGKARWAIGGGPQPAVGNIPQEAADALKRGEGTAEQFDAIFGQGAAARVMGGGASNGAGGFRLVSNAKAIAEKVFPGVRVTDWRRDPNSRLGRANPKSFHNRTGAAIDMAPIPGMTFEQAAQRFRAAGYNVHPDSRDEVSNPSGHATGPHWHFVLGEAA